MCVCAGWWRATMDFPISRCLLVRASTLPPVGIILRLSSLETPFGKLNFRSMCGMFVYGCDLLALREVRLGLLSRIAGEEEVNQGGGGGGGVGEICRFQTLRAW